MSKAPDGNRHERVVFMASASELSALDRWRHAKQIGSRGEAIRRLIVSGLSQQESREELVSRLSSMDADDAAREACGHPLVAGIILKPVLTIQLVDGTELKPARSERS